MLHVTVLMCWPLTVRQNNATGETQGKYANTTSFYFDSLYCSWDTVRISSLSVVGPGLTQVTVQNFLPFDVSP
jgi:hypothetical protein